MGIYEKYSFKSRPIGQFTENSCQKFSFKVQLIHSIYGKYKDFACMKLLCYEAVKLLQVGKS